MNKAFVREPEADGRVFCPRCGTLGAPMGAGVMDAHLGEGARGKLRDAAWFCNFARCDVAYFNEFEVVVLANELKSPVYPKDLDAPICACFGLTYDDVAADASDAAPQRIRNLLSQSKTDAARCAELAADGHSCLPVVQELYFKLRAKQDMA